MCGKQCEFFSQLLSHIHIGSGCLQKLLDSGRVRMSEADLSLDLGPVLGVAEEDRERFIQCAACRSVAHTEYAISCPEIVSLL